MTDTAPTSARQRLLRAALLLTGLIIPQVILYGPSLAGTKILLPLDILRSGSFYLPADKQVMFRGEDGQLRPQNPFRPHNESLYDQILSYEIERRFVASEFRAGRIPLWTPYNYAGAPFVNWPKYSPFNLMYCMVPQPFSLAWIQLVKTLVAGIGAYLFFRHTLTLGFWPATVGAWCFPLTGHFALWQGYPQTYVTVWLPWILLVTDMAVRRPRGRAGPALAVVTALVTVSGQLDTAGHVLLASGIFAIYGLIREYRSHLIRKKIAVAATALIGGWGVGFLLSAPELLPLAEYSLSGSRLSDSGEIFNDRPPSGIRSIPRVVLPRVYGSLEKGWHRLPGHSEFESASAAYTGLLMTLLVAPFAWCSSRHRSVNICLLILALFALAWELNIPGFVHILRWPLFNLRPHNRFVCVASFAILTSAAIGLEALWSNHVKRSFWFAIPAALLLITGAFCAYRSVQLPEPIATELAVQLQSGITSRDIPDAAAVSQIQATYRSYMIVNSGLCLLGLAAGAGLWYRPRFQKRVVVLLVPLLCGELIWFGYGMNPQCDPQLDYPKIPLLERLAMLPHGRVLGIRCLPPKLNEIHGLHELRGYDGVDPARFVELLRRCGAPQSTSPDYAKTLNFVPLMHVSPDGELQLPAILNMLGVRYLIFPQPAPLGLTPVPALNDLTHEGSYLVVESKQALSRVFIPRSVEVLEKPRLILMRMSSPEFDPRETAYAEESVLVPADCRGSAEIIGETSMEVTVSVEMETEGLLVLADRWDRGWRAWSGDRELPIVRTNYVLRGVVVKPGDSTIVFRYEPQSFVWGVRLFLMATVILVCWSIAAVRAGTRNMNIAMNKLQV